jgi:fructose-1,6-bisphosphatase I
MVHATAASSSHALFSTSLSSSNFRVSPLYLGSKLIQTVASKATSKIPCKVVGSTVTVAETKAQKKDKKGEFQIENLTIWLLKQEQAGNIDAELTVVLSSISLACKQIASLLQRSSIINLTGAHGTINIQGEDQKKLDVISNEVRFQLLSNHTKTFSTIVFAQVDMSARLLQKRYWN